jgi:tryptophanyl-tRNA synthetase
VSDESLRKIYWYENGKYQCCQAFNLFALLQNGAQELKRCVNECSDSNPYSYWKQDIKKMLAELLEMARKKNEYKGKITYYKSRGYLLNKVNMAELEEWVGKDSIEYIQAYCNSDQG